MSLVSTHSPIYLSTARSMDRAVFVWRLAVASTSALALYDGENVAAYFVAIILPLFPDKIPSVNRVGLIAVSMLIYSAGPFSLLMAAPVALAISRNFRAASLTFLVLVSLALSAHHIQSSPEVSGQTLNLASLSYLGLSLLACLLIFGQDIGWRGLFTLSAAFALVAIFIDAAAGRWLNYEILTSPFFRTSMVVAPIVASAFGAPKRNEGNTYLQSVIVFGAAAVGFALAAFLPANPIKQIVFDESHGPWETVKATFSAGDFGRAANYNYALLGNYAGKIAAQTTVLESESGDLPPKDALFVLKMPALPLSEDFSERLFSWIIQGGRLLVVADHTDLYDTTQNLNRFLHPRFGLRIRSDAIFNRYGMPPIVLTAKSGALIARIDANSRETRWQTGASLARMPINAIQMAAYGPSFSEQGDYSNANRFGAFMPRSTLRYLNHSAIVGFTSGAGAVAIILDSTPWSNFSIFKQQYTHLFRGLVHSLAYANAMKILGWSATILSLVVLAASFWTHTALLGAAGLLAGVSLGCAFLIGGVSHASPVDGRDFGLRVAAGSAAHFEFLSQLVPTGERNFSRITSSMAKYDLMPSALDPGESLSSIRDAKRWLLLQPSASQLPEREQILGHLTGGGDLTVLFAPEQTSQPEIIAWLTSLGLYIQKVTAVGVLEDATPGGFLTRRGPSILRDVRSVSRAISTSRLNERSTDPLFQVYTNRPTQFPRKSGLLTIGFSADQFSDDAVGDVWEGIHPTSIGRLREKQLASVLLGEEQPGPFPIDLSVHRSQGGPSTLRRYLFMQDGKIVLNGTFDDEKRDEMTSVPAAPLENAVGYLFKLRNHADAFVTDTCPRSGQVTECKQRMVGPEMMEWMVSWISHDDGRVRAIELLHERRFSSVGNTINVVFGE